MSRTPCKKAIASRLKALNDQLWFYFLLEHEFDEKLRDFGPGIAQAFTTDLFARNPNAQRIRVRLNSLPQFRDSHREIALGAHVSTSYEFASTFFESAAGILNKASVVPFRQPRRQKEGPERYYERALAASALAPAPAAALATLAFCRHRRNAFIHLHTAPNAAFVAFCRTHGASLNARWANKRGHLDFTIADVGPFTHPSALLLLQTMLIAVEELDAHLFTLLSIAGMCALAKPDGLPPLPAGANAAVAQERAARIRYWVRRDFGQDPGAPAALAAARN